MRFITIPRTILTVMILALFASAAPAMDEGHGPMTTAAGIHY